MSGTPILIIDDDVAVLEGLTEFLEDEGYEVHRTQDARDALALFRAVNPELVMTDLRMPGISGIEVIKEIRKIDQDTPVIVLTGYGSLESAIDAMHLKVFDFLKKPYDLSTLKAALDRARKNHAAARKVQLELNSLRDQVNTFQTLLKDQLSKFSDVEPLIYTSKLLAGVLHDVNNPLMHIMGQAELLQLLHPEIENLGVIQKQAERIRSILTTIMQRLKTSQSRRLEWVQLNEILVNEVHFLECHSFFKNEIKKEWCLGKSLSPVRGIAGEFSQIFGNILRNAAEAMMHQERKNLTISSWQDSAGVHVSIQDNGPGIPYHLQDKIFQPFYSTKCGGVGIVGSMGMGIGLYYCRELVEQYGGELEVLSEANWGTAFVIHFPVAIQNPSPAEKD
jgi:signal transduction histidine kinase